jgi:hypothetical protein
MPSKLTAKTTRAARQLPDAGLEGQQGVAQIGLLAALQPLADLVQTQAEKGAHQQEAGRERQRVGRRMTEDHQQGPAHGHEAQTIEQRDARRAAQIAPAGRQPAQRIAPAQGIERDVEGRGAGFGRFVVEGVGRGHAPA